MPAICSFTPCGRPVQAKGLCNSHYWQRWDGRTLSTLRKDKPPRPRKARVRKPKPSREELFWSKVEKTDTCWLWTAGRCGRDRRYGKFGVGYPRAALAHRWSYENAYGPIPAGMQVDHICRVTLCVRPDHLRLATNKQNHENVVAQRDSKTGVRGVYYDPRVGTYYVQVTHNGNRHCGRTYSSLDEAERAAIALRNRLYTHNDTDRRAS